jgi:hypothetical protein
MRRGKEHFNQEAAPLANQSDVADFRPPGVAVPTTLTDEQFRYLVALLERQRDSIAADLRVMLAAAIGGAISKAAPQNRKKAA